MTKDRGFNKLKGVTITKINAKAINEVALFDDAGNFYVIGSETGPLGIPVLTLTKHKEQKYELPRTPRPRVSNPGRLLEREKELNGKKPKPKPVMAKPKPVMAAWPYPPEKETKKRKKD
jgi:hypothetical protein